MMICDGCQMKSLSLDLISAPRKVVFPLHRQQLFLLIIALLTTGHHIAFGGLTPPGNGNDVIHG